VKAIAIRAAVHNRCIHRREHRAIRWSRGVVVKKAGNAAHRVSVQYSMFSLRTPAGSRSKKRAPHLAKIIRLAN
jgi:hypothetical protein